MALFNIFLENDDPNQKPERENLLPGDWANEFVQRSKEPTDLNDLQKRTAAKTVKETFLNDKAKGEFQTSVVLSKKILDVLMRNPDFNGIRIYLGVDKKSTKDKPRNTFIVVPINDELKNITGNSHREQAATSGQSYPKSDVAYYTEDGTACPPRLGCDDSTSFI